MISCNQTVSVIIPVYNAQETIERCIASVLEQDYSEWKMILIDDGSTDDSARIVDEWSKKDGRIEVIHQKNAGVSSARNMGLAHADTDYVVFLDSDDWLEKSYISRLVRAAAENRDSSHIWCGFNAIHMDGNIEQYVLSSEEFSYYDRKDYMTLFENWLAQMPWNHLYSNRIIQSNNLRFDETMSLGEDLLFNMHYLDCTHQSKIVVINMPLYNYRIADDGSLTSKYRSDFLSIVERLNLEMKEFLQKWNVSERGWEMYNNMVFYRYESAMINCFNENNKAPFMKKIAYNNAILRKPEFIISLRVFTGNIHPLFRLAYKTKEYRLVLLITYIAKLKNRIAARKNTDD